jgi:hypothetical protein
MRWTPPPRDGRQADAPTIQLRVCAVGTPGIGKSTCTPVLIKMLLERKKTVVYRVRSEDNDEGICEFIPGSGDGDPVAANVYPAQAFRSGIPSLSEASTFYVVDPGMFKGSCNPSVTFLPKVIIVASPDSKHWGANEFNKRRMDVKGVLKFFPVWELHELLHARPVVRPAMTDQQVKDRYLCVGGVPRHIFADDKDFQEVLDLQSNSLNSLTDQQVTDLAKLHLHSFATFDESQPKSALIGYRVLSDDDDDGSFSRYTCDAIAPAVVAKAEAAHRTRRACDF